MSHIVKCRWCNEYFDTEKLDAADWVKPTQKSYYHKKCYIEKTQPEIINLNKKIEEISPNDLRWRDYIFDYISHNLKQKPNHGRIGKQINDFRKQNNWTIKDMYLALIYYYSIMKKPWIEEKAKGGIYIIKYVYYNSKKYWEEQLKKDANIIEAIKNQINKINAENQIKKIQYNQKKIEKEETLSLDKLLQQLNLED